MMPSFFGEKTAEYVLVPQLRSELLQYFDSVIPISYWRTREGNRTSLGIHRDCSFKVLAMFARRPKTTDSPSVLSGRVNPELYSFAEAAGQYGILTVAGFPTAKSIPSLYTDPGILWLPINSSIPEEFFVDLSRSVRQVVDSNNDPVQSILVDEIVDYVHHRATTFAWQQAMDLLHHLRAQHRGTYFSLWGDHYKPVYFLLSDAAAISDLF